MLINHIAMKKVCREMLEPDISVMYPRPLEVLVISVKQALKTSDAESCVQYKTLVENNGSIALASAVYI